MIRDMRAGLFDNTTEGKIAKIQYLRGLERENIDDSAKSMYDPSLIYKFFKLI